MTTKTEYKFITGNGDDAQAAELSAAGKDGWKAIEMEFNPDETITNNRLVVLLERPLATQD